MPNTKPDGNYADGTSSQAGKVVSALEFSGTAGAFSSGTTALYAEVPTATTPQSNLEVGTGSASRITTLGNPYIVGVQHSGEVGLTSSGSWSGDLAFGGSDAFAYELIARWDADPANGSQGPVCLNFASGNNEEPLSLVFSDTPSRVITVYANRFLGASEASVDVPAPTVGTYFHLIAVVDYSTNTLSVWMDSDTAVGTPTFTAPAASDDATVQFAVMAADWGAWELTQVSARFYDEALSQSEVEVMLDYPWEVVGQIIPEATSTISTTGASDGYIQGPIPFQSGEDSDKNINFYGQSLAIGPVPALTTSQPFNSVDTAINALVNTTAERPGVPATNHLRNETGAGPRFVTGLFGQSGQAYVNLRKGTANYNTMMTNIAAAHSSVGILIYALNFIHGETDTTNECEGLGCEGRYGGYLSELQTDFDTDCKATTGQTRDVALFVCQTSSGTANGESRATVPMEQLDAALGDDLILLVGPKYHLEYQADGVHLTSAGSRILGDYHGRALAETFENYRPWMPLHIIRASASGSTITLTYYVPAKHMDTMTGGVPLALDTTTIPAAYSSGDGTTYGFEVIDSSPNPRHVVSVALGIGANAHQVTLTLSGTVRTGTVVEYGGKGILNATSGVGVFHGNLRDTDSSTGYSSGATLYNWAAHQKITASGGVAHDSSIATTIEDRVWTYGITCDPAPATATSDWPETFGGVDFTRLTGSVTTGQPTLDADPTSIGVSREDSGVLSSGIYQATDASFNPTGENDFLFRFQGNIQRPSSGNEYLFWLNDLTANNYCYAVMNTSGNITVVCQTGGANLTYGVAAILPTDETMGLIDIYIEKDPVLKITIAVNKTINSSSAGSAGGAISGPVTLLGAFNSTGATNRMVISALGAVGLDAGWWTTAEHATDYEAMLPDTVEGEATTTIAISGTATGNLLGLDPVVEGEATGAVDFGAVVSGRVIGVPAKRPFTSHNEGSFMNRRGILSDIGARIARVTRANGYALDVAQTHSKFLAQGAQELNGNYPAVCYFQAAGQPPSTQEVARHRVEFIDVTLIIHVKNPDPIDRAWQLDALQSGIMDELEKDSTRGGWAHSTILQGGLDSSEGTKRDGSRDVTDLLVTRVRCEYVPGLTSGKPMRYAEIYISSGTLQTLAAATWTTITSTWTGGELSGSNFSSTSAGVIQYDNYRELVFRVEFNIQVLNVTAGDLSIRVRKNSTDDFETIQDKSTITKTVGANEVVVLSGCILMSMNQNDTAVLELSHSVGGDVTAQGGGLIITSTPAV